MGGRLRRKAHQVASGSRTHPVKRARWRIAPSIKHLSKYPMLSFKCIAPSVPTKNIVGLDIKAASSWIDDLRARGALVRVLHPNQAHTMDARRCRYNVVLDKAGKVVGVGMG
jgi:hypothetical protein